MSEFNELVLALKKAASKITIENGKPNDLISFMNNKGGSVSVWMVEPVSKSKSKLLFKLEQKGRDSEKYISVMMKTAARNRFKIPPNVEEKSLSSSPDSTYLIFRNDNHSVIDFFEYVIIDGVQTFQPSDRFGCCHRYAECSEVGKCIHPDQFYSLACWYRKNLEAGKVFY